MLMGGTASQDGNLAQLSKVSKEKPPIKRNLTSSDVPIPHFKPIPILLPIPEFRADTDTDTADTTDTFPSIEYH